MDWHCFLKSNSMLKMPSFNITPYYYGLWFIVLAGKLQVLDYLINELEQDPLAKDKDGMITVHAATQNERASTVKVRRLVLAHLHVRFTHLSGL